MFTGLVQEIGVVRAAETVGSLRRITVDATEVMQGGKPGDSIAVDGACLTATAIDAGAFTVEAVPASLERTTLGALAPGRRVNLERALTVGEPLGGHIVQGHVDGVGVVRTVRRDADLVLFDVAVPEDVFGVTVLHGSITMAGVSLTVNALPREGVVQVSLIPFTLEHTTFGGVEQGDRLNIEADLIARLVSAQTRRWLEAHAADGAASLKSGR